MFRCTGLRTLALTLALAGLSAAARGDGATATAAALPKPAQFGLAVSDQELGREVIVDLAQGGSLRGVLLAQTADALVLRCDGREQAVPKQNVLRLRHPGKAWLWGLLASVALVCAALWGTITLAH